MAANPRRDRGQEFFLPRFPWSAHINRKSTGAGRTRRSAPAPWPSRRTSVDGGREVVPARARWDRDPRMRSLRKAAALVAGLWGGLAGLAPGVAWADRSPLDANVLSEYGELETPRSAAMGGAL